MNTINLSNINLGLVNSIVQAIELVKQEEQRNVNLDANRNFIEILAKQFDCFDLQDFDTTFDWRDESDDMKVFYLIFTDAIRAFVNNDDEAFEVLGTDKRYTIDGSGGECFAAQMVFRLSGDTLTVNGEYVLSKSASGWEVNRSKPISYEINGRTIEVDDPISDDFDSLAKIWIIEGKCLKKTDTLKLENAISLLNENKALVEILPRVAN